jgi:hypothetical protein
VFNATPILKLVAAFRARQLAAQDPRLIQERQLRRLLSAAKDTAFGRAHDFSRLRTIADYQRTVPLRTYDKFWEEYFKAAFPVLDNVTWPGRIPYFAVSSGTSSGTTKYIPYTHEMTDSNTRAGLDLLVHHVLNRPRSKLFAGRCFMLGGSTNLVSQADGVLSGDLSGIAVKTMRWWARQRYFPPADLALLENWEEKIERLAQESLRANIRMISGVPSWMLILLKRLSELVPESEGKITGIYPDLEMLVHGGVSFTPYYDTFRELLKGSHAELREVYPASEGFIAVADRGYGEGLRIVLDHGIFFEFVPFDELDSPNPTRHTVHSVELGVNYAIVLTTCAGLWSYVLGDTVRFVDLSPPRILVTGRTSYYLSAFGEHLIAEEIEDAVSVAATAIGLHISDYSVGPLYPTHPGELGGHLYVVETAERVPTADEQQAFLAALDGHLCKRNEDYKAHRAEGFGLHPPRAQFVPAGTFAEWMRVRGKLGGQHKVPRIIMKQELFDHLRNHVSHVSLEHER